MEWPFLARSSQCRRDILGIIDKTVQTELQCYDFVNPRHRNADSGFIADKFGNYKVNHEGNRKVDHVNLRENHVSEEETGSNQGNSVNVEG